jgi:hypothetical protein
MSDRHQPGTLIGIARNPQATRAFLELLAIPLVEICDETLRQRRFYKNFLKENYGTMRISIGT